MEPNLENVHPVAAIGIVLGLLIVLGTVAFLPLPKAQAAKLDPCEKFFQRAEEALDKSRGEWAWQRTQTYTLESIAASLLYQNCRAKEGNHG